MLRTLSVVITDEGRDAPALAAAAALARREDAHLEVTCVGIVPLEMIPMEMGPALLESNADHALEQARSLAAWARSHVPPDIRTSLDALAVPSLELTSCVANIARFSDLVITVRPYGPGHSRLAPIVTEALLFGSGTPVLVVPDADRTTWDQPLRRVCLAWNDSDEAMRATRGALPFLRSAEQVEVVLVRPLPPSRNRAGPAAALLRWLDRHNVNARVSTLDRTEKRKADLLFHFAAERSCEALVMGAYGHSRLREALLGGTTRDMLAEVRLPLLMGH